MGRRLIAIASLAALLGVWIWGNLRPVPEAPPVAAPAADRPTAIGTPVPPLGSGAAATGSPRDEMVRAAPDETETSATATRTAVGAGPPLLIEVVDLDGRAVPGASVWVHEIPADGRRLLVPDLDDVLPRLELEVEPRIADNDGRATLVWPPVACQVVAATDELAGSCWTTGAEDRDGSGRAVSETRRSPFRLVLGPRGGWRARVVRSGSGLPVAGIPVSTRFHYRNEDGRPEALWSWDGESRPTNADGLAAVPLHRSTVPKRPERISVGVIGVFEQPPMARLDMHRTDGVHAHFEVPPTGSLSIEVLDATGRPVRDAEISVVPESMNDQHPWLGYGSIGGKPIDYPGMRNVYAPHGRSRVEHVELDLPIVVKVAVDGRAHPHIEHLTLASDRSITVTLPEALIELTGRLLRAHGSPHARQGVRWAVTTLPARGRSPRNELVRTDATGRFRIALGADSIPTSPSLAALFLTKGELSEGLLVDVRDRLAPGEHDLGELRLEHYEALVAGQVLDQAGEPVEKAEVELRPTGSSRPRAWRHQERNPGWLDDLSIAPLAVTNGDGWFVLRGRPGWIEAWSLSVVGPHIEPLEDQHVALGRADLRLVVRRKEPPPSGSIAGRLLLSDAVRERLRASAGFGVDAVRGTERRTGWVMGDGRFEVNELEAGAWTLDVRLQGTSVIHTRLEDVHVPEDGAASDPRLDPIDLRASLRALRIRAFDVAGEPIAGVWALPPRQRAFFALFASTMRRGTDCVVLAGTDPIDLVVGAPGFLEQELAAVDADRDVVLERGLPVRVVWIDPVEPPDGTRFRPCLTRLEDGQQVVPCVQDEASAFDRDSESLWETARPGEYRVSLILESIGAGVGGPLLMEEAPTVRVEDTTAEQRIEVEFDADAVRAALERFTAR